jgi:glucan biosynthesis protein
MTIWFRKDVQKVTVAPMQSLYALRQTTKNVPSEGDTPLGWLSEGRRIL